MRDSIRTIQFPFSFQFPNGGIQDLSDSITVCEPSYDTRHVYRRMQAILGDVAKAMAIIQAEMMAKRGTAAQETVSTPAAASEPDAEPDIVDQVRVVLGTSGFEDFANYHGPADLIRKPDYGVVVVGGVWVGVLVIE